LFEQVEISVAEELLAEYNDFYLYNQSQYYEVFKKARAQVEEGSEEINLCLAEKNAKETTDYFTKLFGSKDFAMSTMMGLKICWYELQQILLSEFKNKTPIAESAIIHTAYQLRNLASLLLFAEHVVYGMGRAKNSTAESVFAIKQNFRDALEKLDKLTIPEFHKERKQLAKLKTIEQYQEFVNKLLGE